MSPLRRDRALGQGLQIAVGHPTNDGRRNRPRARIAGRREGGRSDVARRNSGSAGADGGFWVEQRVKVVPPLLRNNRYSVLAIEDDCSDSDTKPESAAAHLPTVSANASLPGSPRPPRFRKNWEQRLTKDLRINVVDSTAASISIPIALRLSGKELEIRTKALVDTGANGDFIDAITFGGKRFRRDSYLSRRKSSMWTDRLMTRG